MAYLKRWPHTDKQSALANWRAARDNAANEPVDVVYYGNSLTQDGGVGDLAINGGYPTHVANWMNANLGKQHGVGFECCRTYSGSGAPARWTYTDNSGTFATNNPSNAGIIAGFGLWTCAIAPTDVMTYTGVMDRFDLLYIKTKTTSGTIEIRVDGDLKDSVDTQDAAQTGTTVQTFEASNIWTSEAMTNGSHTITLTNAGSDVVYVEGIFVYNTNYDSGFRFWNGAHSGYWGAYHNDNNGRNSFDILKRLQPALAVWTHFYNDRHGTLAAYTNALNNFITKVRTYSPNTDILICTEWQTQRWTPSHLDYDTMRASAAYIATLNNAGFLDLGGFIESVGYDGNVTDPMHWVRNESGSPPNNDKEHQTVPYGFLQFAKIHWAYLNDVKPPSRPQEL